MIKKIVIILILLVSFYLLYSPLVIQLQNQKILSEIKLKKNNVFKLKDFIYLGETKKYTAYIVLDKEEFDNINSKIPKHKILVCKDSAVIKDLLNCKFNYTEADVSTIENKIYIYSDNDLIFEGQISLDDDFIGIQNRDFGWIKSLESNRFVESVSKFKRYNLPILIIK